MITRLETLIQNLELNQKDFASKIGISPSRITELRRGRIKTLSSDTLIRIHQEFGVNINWLLTGEGEMFLTSTTQSAPAVPDPAPEQPKTRHLSSAGGKLDLQKALSQVHRDNISLTDWFNELSADEQFLVAAANDVSVDPAMKAELRRLWEFMLSKKDDSQTRQKGEAG